MTQIKRWDTGAVIYEGNGTIAELMGQARKLGISCFRADLSRADLRGTNLRETNLREAKLCDADLRDADLSGADLCDADLSGADLSRAKLCDTDLPIWCRWVVSYKLNPAVVVSIGSKTKSIQDWDAWFAGSEEFETSRDDEKFLRIWANYLAVRAYLVALGHFKDPT
jgi:hypothetical protein